MAFCVPNRFDADLRSFECAKNMKLSWPYAIRSDGRDAAVYMWIDADTPVGDGGFCHIIVLSW